MTKKKTPKEKAKRLCFVILERAEYDRWASGVSAQQIEHIGVQWNFSEAQALSYYVRIKIGYCRDDWRTRFVAVEIQKFMANERPQVKRQVMKKIGQTESQPQVKLIFVETGCGCIPMAVADILPSPKTRKRPQQLRLI